MMRTALLIATSCLLFGTASADRRIVEQLESSYELVLKDVTLPSGAGGTIIFPECENCSLKSMRVNADTRYLLNGTDLALEDLVRRVADIRRNGTDTNTGVYVHYEIKTSAVNRVRVIEFPAAAR
jgi:hypothetical protein